MDYTTCCICGNTITKSARYPNLICMNHINETIDQDGNPVQYENEDMYGGLVSIHTVGNTIIKKKDYICYVRGRKCIVGEARFGGIVIQCINNKVD